MDKLINLVDSTVEVNNHENFLQQFVPKVTVWDYNSMSWENYLALPRDEKEKIIRNYYSEMLKGHRIVGAFIFLFE